MLHTSNSLKQLKAFSFGYWATNAIIVGFLPIYLQHKGLSNSHIGFVLAVGPLASIFAQPFWGYMSDKHKTVKRIIQICLFGFLGASVIFFNMGSYFLILLFAFILFFFAIPIGSLTDSLSQRMALKHGVSFGGIKVWGSVGFCIASFTIGFILHKIGIDLILFLLIPLIVMLLIIVIYVPDADYEKNSKISLGDIKGILKNRKFTLFLLFAMFLALTQRANDSFIGLYVSELGGFESQVGTAWAMALLGEAIVYSTSYLWFRRLHVIHFIIIAGIFYSIRWFAYSIIKEPNILFLFQLLNGPSFAVFYMSSFAFVTSILPKNMQSTGHLLFATMLFGISGVISSSIGGLVLDILGGSYLYSIMGIFSIVGSLLLVIYYVKFIKKPYPQGEH